MSVQQATATSNTTINSRSYTLINSMTITPGAGDYIASFTSSFELNDGNEDVFIAFFVNGAKVDHTERKMRSDGSVDPMFTAGQIFAYLPSVGAGEAVEVRLYSTAGTATIAERTLTLQDVDSSDISQATATNDISTTSTSDTLMTNMSVTPGTAGDYIVYFGTSLYGDAGAIATFSIYVNGVKQAHTERELFCEGSIPDTEYIYGVVAGVNLSSDTDTIEIRWRDQGGGGPNIRCHERTLVAQKVSSYQQATATGDTTTSSTSYGLLNSMTVTPGSGDWLAFFTSSAENDVNSNWETIQFRLTDAGSGIAQWIGYNIDQADVGSDNLRERESTSVKALSLTIPQATYDYLKWETEVFVSIPEWSLQLEYENIPETKNEVNRCFANETWQTMEPDVLHEG